MKGNRAFYLIPLTLQWNDLLKPICISIYRKLTNIIKGISYLFQKLYFIAKGFNKDRCTFLRKDIFINNKSNSF